MIVIIGFVNPILLKVVEGLKGTLKMLFFIGWMDPLDPKDKTATIKNDKVHKKAFKKC